jgi:carbon-monoxide dehydrogenase large subunit
MANVVGQRVRRREDPRFLLGQGQYVDDIGLEGALHAGFVRSAWAHATVTSVDGSDAVELPGVQVFTAAEIELETNPPPPFLELDPRMHRRFVARDRVRFAGEIVAVVLAESPEVLADALDLVVVDFEPLPVVTDIEAAARDEVLLFEDVGTNTCVHVPPAEPDENLFADCEVVVEGVLRSQRLAVCPIEPRATAAKIGDDGRLTIWLSTQTPHSDRDGLAAHLGLEPARVRVVAPDVGGGFGGKGLSTEDVLVAYFARRTGHPVRWTETRTENFLSMNHGRAQNTRFRIGGGRDGRVKALRLDILQDTGAYPSIGAFLPQLTAMMSSGVYAIPKIEIDNRAVVTNTTHTAAYRGAGRPEAAQIIERAMDAFALELSLDPAAVRRVNFIPNDQFPYTTASGATYDIGDYDGALTRALEQAGYEQLRAEQSARRATDHTLELGIGISVYVEVTNGFPEGEFGAVEITADGGAIVRTGSFSHGQGHETTFAQIASERLGIPVERITVLKGDTDRIARGGGTYGSKSTQIGGAAANQASEEVVERAKQVAADELEANPDDMVLDLEAGTFHVVGSPQPALAWSDLATRLEGDGRLGELSAEVDFEPAAPTFPFGAHVAVVEVDTETGAVELKRMIACDDAGTIINPMIAEGQVHGGLASGIAQALHEQMTYDEDGNPQNANFVTYGIPAATELPSFERVPMETPTPINPLGAKGIGESATIGSTPAVLNAVIDALAPYGIRELDMPANGESVWRAIQEANGRAS